MSLLRLAAKRRHAILILEGTPTAGENLRCCLVPQPISKVQRSSAGGMQQSRPGGSLVKKVQDMALDFFSTDAAVGSSPGGGRRGGFFFFFFFMRLFLQFRVLSGQRLMFHWPMANGRGCGSSLLTGHRRIWRRCGRHVAGEPCS